MDPLPSFSPPAQPTQVHRHDGRFTSLRLAGRLGSLASLPELAPLTGLVSLDVRGMRIERLDLGAARSLEVLHASDTPLVALLAYWRRDLARVRGSEEDGRRALRDLLGLVEARVAAGGYATAVCQYDPVADGFGAGHMDDCGIPAAVRRCVP